MPSTDAPGGNWGGDYMVLRDDARENAPIISAYGWQGRR